MFTAIDGGPGLREWEPATATTVADLRTSRLRIVKTPGAFDTMPSAGSADENDGPPADLAADLNRAAIVLGHTRFRTQGATAALEHTSPLLVDSVVGTHNGDVDVDTLPAPPPRTRPKFDTELLLAALSDAGGDRAAICDLLTGMVGRTALVWADLRDPMHLHLARAALSPLAVARDQFGRLHWASNPGWLRTHLPAVGLRPTGLRMLREGTVETYDLRGGVPESVWRADFVPTTRESDLRKRHSVALLGYTDRDRAADDALLRRRVLSSSA
ncbi:class II glutamine amidotransferase domain-containing protein [Saccharopolyspora gloriosae]|uniref:Glutamine amidotransferase type-2 domain-containing protein n=1 Tax=Saccharopolyspora gloriosae TaxID=455344 RepID=A0A840N7N5_9PSEU|nr:hypothetical protein [Saccharopolyspora gloriosae]MBB5067990.1 hypothetical protein [Saccharopolyspora gloriosae]